MTTNRNTQSMTRADFGRMLDVYGADRTRWPLAARASAVSLLASDRQAQRLLSEAVALDAVLLQAPEPSHVEIAGLAERIMAALPSSSVASPVAEPRGASPVPLGASVRRADRFSMRAAALMAASLLVGVFVGQTTWGARAVPVLESLTGIARASTSDQTAMADIRFDTADEDHEFE